MGGDREGKERERQRAEIKSQEKRVKHNSREAGLGRTVKRSSNRSTREEEEEPGGRGAPSFSSSFVWKLPGYAAVFREHAEERGFLRLGGLVRTRKEVRK